MKPFIDPEMEKLGCELSFRMGQSLREDLLKAGIAEEEIDEIVKKAFAWRYEE